MNRLEKIRQLVNFVIRSERNWSKIEEKKTVIYQDASVDLFAPLVSDYVVVDTSSRKLSMRALAVAMLSRKFYRNPIQPNYVVSK